jgi:hypothetical protein
MHLQQLYLFQGILGMMLSKVHYPPRPDHAQAIGQEVGEAYLRTASVRLQELLNKTETGERLSRNFMQGYLQNLAVIFISCIFDSLYIRVSLGNGSE